MQYRKYQVQESNANSNHKKINISRLKFISSYSALSLLLLAALFFVSCNNNSEDGQIITKDNAPTNLLEGRWRGSIGLGSEELNFNFDITEQQDGKLKMTILNADERIDVEDITFTEDSVFIKLPVFDSELKGKWHPMRIMGEWHDYARGDDYQLPFYARYNDSTRFDTKTVNDPDVNIEGRWQGMFIAKDRSGKDDAIGEFKQNGPIISGTFMTPTGDYRYLEGLANGKEISLSAFDGAHAFLFKAEMGEGGDLVGTFWSGTHYEADMYFYRSDTATLADPNKMTLLKKGYDKLAFSFPNLKGKKVTLDDPKYKGKVVLVQIMGTWCPNCMDETVFYSDVYKTYKDQGLEVIALAYEKANNLQSAKPQLERYQERFDIQYDMLYAGKATKEGASESLPMLDEVKSFPTTIFIDRNGEVRRIHTGFTGPATSEYDNFVEDFKGFLEGLLQEAT
ncbi:MAG: TlpA disulfide reductase family protein [Chitinophagales bacterium]